jgi:hypothetical protein
MGSIKKDSGKPKIHLIPTEAIFDLVSVIKNRHLDVLRSNKGVS